MHITFTEKALNQLKGFNIKNGYLKLRYETDGCGCVVSGVNALWLVDQPDDGDITIETNAHPVLVEESKQVFLDDQLTIDFSDRTKMFLLKSPNQILTPRMSFLDRLGLH